MPVTYWPFHLGVTPEDVEEFRGRGPNTEHQQDLDFEAFSRSSPGFTYDDFLQTTKLRERDLEEIARRQRTLQRLDMERERLRAELDDSVGTVSRDFQKSAAQRLDDLEFFANRLLQENAEKQAKPEIVARQVSRTKSMLERYALSVAGDRIVGRVRPKNKFSSKNFSSVTTRQDTVPRSVFGTEAIVNRVVHSMHLNGGFLTRAIVVPCIQRAQRREVMFAKNQNRGHRGRRRRSRFGDIWC